MCGIAGRIGVDAKSPLIIEAMIGVMDHRGPDDVGFYFSSGVQLAMSRLAIIGVMNGKQPLTNESGTIHVVCNGEIYNYQNLRLTLAKLGHELLTDSDVEVISHLYEEYGLDFVHHLRGMFSIALWDSEKTRLVLVRDRLGKKPLLYMHTELGGIQFASEMKALLCAVVKKEPDFSAIDATLALGYPLSPATGFKDIYSLMPANILVWQEGKISIKEYWNLADQVPIDCSFQEATDLLESTLTTATELRLISERPIGALLSGGIDSSLVTALMAKISNTRIKTFSVGFSEREFNESHHARRVAEHLGTDHHELIVKPDPQVLLDRVSKIADIPFADSSIIPTFLVSELAKRDVTVALSGDGGDEAFGGYLRYRAMPLIGFVNPLLKLVSPIHGVLQAAGESSKSEGIQRIARNLQYYPTNGERYFSFMSWLTPSQRQSLWNPDISYNFTSPPIESQFRTLWDSSQSENLSLTCMHMDSKTYLPGDLNYKVDMASMANSLEIRSPLMDQKVYELAAQLPIRFHIKGQESKRLLKNLLSRYVPSEITERPKMGFGIPRASWLRNELNPLMRELLLGEKHRSRAWFNVNETQKWIAQHEAGRNVDQILWPLMMIELWAQNWLD